MGEWIKLKASDGFELSAWRAEPKGAPRGGFGRRAGDLRRQRITSARSPTASPPTAISRSRRRSSIAANRGFDVGYEPEAMARGFALARQDRSRDDAARRRRRDRSRQGGRQGRRRRLCLGGTLAWLAAAKVAGLAAAVGYYGGGIRRLERPEAAALRPCCISARRTRTSRSTACASSRRRIPTCRSSPIRRRPRASTATARRLRRAERDAGAPAARWRSSPRSLG